MFWKKKNTNNKMFTWILRKWPRLKTFIVRRGKWLRNCTRKNFCAINTVFVFIYIFTYTFLSPSPSSRPLPSLALPPSLSPSLASSLLPSLSLTRIHQPLLKCNGTAGQELISEPPNMLILHKLHVFERITSDVRPKFGVFLLDDRNGYKMDAIFDVNWRTDTETINREIFRRWLRGDGRTPVTWNTLIEVLRDVTLHTLADDISRKVKQADCNVSVLPFDYSEKILKAIDPLKDKYRAKNTVEIGHIKPVKDKLPFLELLMRDNNGNVKTLEGVLKGVHVRKQLLITGQPGSGKTTLLRYLAKQWADEKALHFCQILFLIILEDYKDDYHNLNDLLNVHYKEWDVHANDIVHRNGNGTCFLLDGFDEKLNKRDFVYRLMTNNELPFSVIIVTSRPDDDLLVIKYQVEVVGFQFDKLDDYLFLLSDNKTANRIQKEFWNDRQVKEMCQLPLNMAMVIFIANRTQTSSIQTKTQIYTSFMNATVIHYEWDAHSLRRCIHRVLDDDLCKAFTHICIAAFEMTFNQRYTFPVDVKLQENIRRLGFVSLIEEDPISEKFKFTFSHPTFMEFFAALHLVTLPQSQQRFHVQNPAIKRRQELVDFYFGLLGDIYGNNITAVSLPLKHYSAAFASPLNKWEHVCPSKFYMAHSSSSLRLHQEIGWKGNAYKSLLQSAGIVIDSSSCISLANSKTLSLHYLLENANINRLSILGYSASLSAVSFEDQAHPLNASHLELLKCLTSSMSCVNEQLHSTVTYLHSKTSKSLIRSRTGLKSTFKNLKKFCNLQSLGLTFSDPKLLVSNEFSHNLSTLNISSVEIHCCFEELWILLKHFPNIITLYIELLNSCMYQTHQIQDLVSTTLSSALTRPHRIQNLIIRPAISTNISQLLRDQLSALRYLRIEKMDINGTTTDQLIRVANKNLTVFDLSHCTLHGLAIEKLALKLELFSKLQNLNFYAVGLTDSDVHTLSKSIKTLCNLTYLGLASNKINGEGLQQLVEVLKEIKTFRSLNLYGNPITGQENIRVLSQMTNLRALHISISSNGDKEALFNVVQQLPQLESFRWSRLD